MFHECLPAVAKNLCRTRGAVAAHAGCAAAAASTAVVASARNASSNRLDDFTGRRIDNVDAFATCSGTPLATDQQVSLMIFPRQNSKTHSLPAVRRLRLRQQVAPMVEIESASMGDQCDRSEEASDEMHAAVLAILPPTLFDLTDLAACRAQLELYWQQTGAALPENVTISETHVPGFDGDPTCGSRCTHPTIRHQDHLRLSGYMAVAWSCCRLTAMTSNVRPGPRTTTAWWRPFDYRLAPETSAPGLVNDCYAAFRHVAANADVLGIDPSRIVLGGASAGGGLAAGTALSRPGSGRSATGGATPGVPHA